MKYDGAVDRAAKEIAAAVDKMVATLPEEVAPHMAIARLVGKLAKAQTQRMQWVMEDPLVRDAYEASLAQIPATPGLTYDGKIREAHQRASAPKVRNSHPTTTELHRLP
jgi:predicted NBD/HSP70 family sugar kinase